ncbi:putative beta-1,3-galactosyltransferase 20 [Dorcoceras hygrometricum]|uniref:Putative beta-1,3-galactosyltransferase 20 n=1 Tax=Dorcoceras hygrometricum TaxID=472368 RepID=A0A2Z7BP53_9LAMI|nr:putative beta-1,3-galactosyltransferase 20 [Dorcoceras hygrometricum]
MSTGYAIALKLATGSTVARDWYIILRLDAQQQLVYCSSRLDVLLLATGCTSYCWLLLRVVPAALQLNFLHLLIVMTLLMSSSFSAPADLYRSSSSLRLFLATVPAGPLAPADLSSSAEHDVVTNDIIIDGPLRCSSWFSFDVPADPSSTSSACSWFISFQLIHYAPAGSNWPLPDFEHLT